MLQIELLEEKDIEEYAEILTYAYPDDDRESIDHLVQFLSNSLKKDQYIKYFKVLKNKEITGTMRFLDYEMNMRNVKVQAKGLGLVAVSPLHRKEGIAKKMMEFYIGENDKSGINFLILYPFDLSFYRKTGFGYGTKHRMYKLLPQSFPAFPVQNLSYMKKEDSPAMLASFQRFAQKTNGMISRREGAFDHTIDGVQNKVIVYKNKGLIEAYLIFHYKKEKDDYEYDSNLIVTELVYHSKESLQSIIGFLHNQKDQVVRIHFNTQDEYLFYLLDNPLNGEKDTFKTDQLESYVSSLSMMYRVTNVPRLFTEFKGVQFGNDSFRIKLTISDSLYPPNNGSTIIKFEKGYPHVCSAQSDYDCEITMDIADFSSLFAGAVTLRKLIQFGLAEISEDSFIEKADRTLGYCEKPQCFTGF